MNLKHLICGLITASWLLTGCSKNSELTTTGEQNSGTGIWAQITGENARTLKITDAFGKPISQAQVLIGEALDQPFPGNFLVSGADGVIQAPKAWTTNQMVTVSAPGFVRATFMGQIPQGQNFQLRPSTIAVQFELKGKSTGLKTKDSDNLIDFALMMPAAQRSDLFSFNLNMFVSPVMDTVSIYGNEIDLPSNLSIPKQKESYGFVPVTLDKPLYRMYFDAMGLYQIVTVRGQFPFKQVVGDMQNGKSYLDIINYFSLKGGSLTPVDISQSSQMVDLPADTLTFTESRNFQAPVFGSDEFILAAALSPYQGQFIPTDFKNISAGANIKLVTAAGETPHLLLALKKTSEQLETSGGKLSAALVPFQMGVRPVLLPLIQEPQVLSLTEVRATPPNPPAGIAPLATYMVLSEVTRQGSGANASESTSRVWEVYAPDWHNEMHLPQWPGETLTAGSKRWEVSYFATQNLNNLAVDLSPRILETVTHATHSATDF